TPGIPVAPNVGPARTVGTGTPAASPYAPVVRAELRNQNLAAGGLLSGGAQAAPTVLLPLQRLQQVLGQPDQISVVLVANQGDPPPRTRLTGQVTSAIPA